MKTMKSYPARFSSVVIFIEFVNVEEGIGTLWVGGPSRICEVITQSKAVDHASKKQKTQYQNSHTYVLLLFDI